MKYFTTAEFACKCGKNCLPVDGMDKNLMQILDLTREKLGHPIHITSAYRCQTHNENVGGAKNSYHALGMAADIYSNNVDIYQLKNLVKQTMQERGVQGGLILYPGDEFLHIDTRGYWYEDTY